MMRFAWIQFRTQTMVVAVGLAVVAVALVVTGPHLVHLYDSTVAHCAARGDCAAATTALTNSDGFIQIVVDLLVLVLPVVIGVFWGAPLVAREYESRTFGLVWTQSVTRTRWLVGKIALGLVVSTVATGLLTLMVTWWSSPFDRVQSNIYSDLYFSVRDVVPIGYAAFSFVLGVTAGVLLRRLLPAMFVALVGYVAVREAVAVWVRPSLFSPLHRSLPLTANSLVGFNLTSSGVSVVTTTRGLLSNAWVYSNQLVDAAGRAPTQAFFNRACPYTHAGGITNVRACIAHIAAAYHDLITYQPASRFWDFQWCELAVFLGLSAILVAVCVAWIRRPVA